MNTFEEFQAALALQIKVELVERGMDQNGLADAIGIERATLSRYMTGKRVMPMQTFWAVAGVFALSPQALMERAEARLAPKAETA